MDEFSELLKPSWGAEAWIAEGWQQISDSEKEFIKNRMQKLFKHGLPFELKHNKLFYLYTFSLLAQLEVLAIQVPLKFAAKMSTGEHQKRMRVQLLDEIFHGMVFTKIAYLLAAPQALPPAYNENIEKLCNFIRSEDCPKVAIVLLNLIAEGWIEEAFNSLQRQGIAPEVFATIIEDEHRHVSDAQLYADIGIPDPEIMRPKLDYLEEQLLSNVFLQYKYMLSISSLLGVNGAIEFLQALDKKHGYQLGKLNLKPSKNWHFYMKLAAEAFPRLQKYSAANYEIPMSPIRKTFMTQWDNPSDPTMVGEFNLNVSCLDFFNKKFPAETLTTLMMQTISFALSETDSFRTYLSHKRLFQSRESYLGVVVMLPDCGDHLGTIVFENCHHLTVQELAIRIRETLKMMVYCFKKREQLEKEHPYLSLIVDEALYDFANEFYPYPIPGSPVVSLSNIGFCGYSHTKSPLRINESMKFTLLEVERKLVWNKLTGAFEPEDILPVSISADHRIFDGNKPVPKMLMAYFQKAFSQMIENLSVPAKIYPRDQGTQFVKLLEQLLANNLELGYRALVVLQTYWLDFLDLQDLLNKNLVKEISAGYES